uniref:Uncharacterized protein n=1 Tax=Arundo donax TaxID=35708 RepID=A0A0A9I3H7_ARUDO
MHLLFFYTIQIHILPECNIYSDNNYLTRI